MYNWLMTLMMVDTVNATDPFSFDQNCNICLSSKYFFDFLFIFILFLALILSLFALQNPRRKTMCAMSKWQVLNENKR